MVGGIDGDETLPHRLLQAVVQEHVETTDSAIAKRQISDFVVSLDAPTDFELVVESLDLQTG